MLRPLTLVLLFIVLLSTLGCKQAGIKPNAEVDAASNSNQIAQSQKVLPVKKTTGKQVMLNQLLEQAEDALQRGRLTKPAHDNAYDKFRAATLLDKDSPEAKSGLDGVLLTLADMVRDDLSAGRLSSANAKLKTIEERFPESEIFEDLKSEWAQAKAQRAKRLAEKRVAIELDPTQYLIPKEYLRKETDIAKAWFSNVGALIKSEDASIMIYARSDAEGRKIYRLIKESVTDYLVRGDIRISDTPKIQFLEPLP